MTGEPDGRRVVLVSVNGVREVDPTWSAWLAEVPPADAERGPVVVDITRGAS